MTRTNIKAEEGNWYWYHNVSECYYDIQLTVKYRKSLFEPTVIELMKTVISGFKERYAIEIHTIGFDQNHVHLLLRFLPKYSGRQVIKRSCILCKPNKMERDKRWTNRELSALKEFEKERKQLIG